MTRRGDVSVRHELRPGIREEAVRQGATQFHNNDISLSGLIGEACGHWSAIYSQNASAKAPSV
ncbi:hypothetical protein EYF80_021064 [Liparis tanakae]|uniref:Uncharacterized protein n=1 Tax=Liparis tanakae TaxID=230148 RepID=A0A4Z2HV05_9TELE|nr:hypothetical protein EYF80_021064 [Liparis tanakae]